MTLAKGTQLIGKSEDVDPTLSDAWDLAIPLATAASCTGPAGLLAREACLSQQSPGASLDLHSPSLLDPVEARPSSY